MVWHDLLFAHWPVPVASLREFIPPDLEIETFDGSAWLGIVPFRMSGIRHRLLPTIPGASAFPELNVRTYVRDRPGGTGEPHSGVWFFTLDATHRLAVRVARATYRLAYTNAAMTCHGLDGWIHYQSRRTGPHTFLACGRARCDAAEFSARYRPIPGAIPSAPLPGTLEHFLTARYCLYAFARGTLYRAEIDHAPWPLAAAEADIQRCTMGEPLGIAPLPLNKDFPILHFSERLDVVAWLPDRLAPR
jgi:uncharacterized protein